MAIGTAAAILGGAAISALAGSKASSSAASTQAKAATEAANVQAAAADRAAALQEPWRQAGIRALPQLEAQTNAMPAAFTGQVNMMADPGYQFRLGEGLKSLDRQAAARGGLISGGALKAAQRFGQDYASNEYQNAYNRALTQYNANVAREATGYNRLASLAGIGQTAGTNVGNLYTGAGAAQAAGLTGAANARASGYVGAANALTGGLSNALNMYQQNQFMNQMFPSYTGGIGSGGFSAAPGTNTMSNAMSNWAPNPFG